MGVSREEVRRVAALARIEIAGAELASMTRQLSTILEHIDALQAVDVPTDGDEPEDEGVGLLRPDEPGADPLAVDPGAQAPAWQDGFFTVPRLPALDDGGPGGGRGLAGDGVDDDPEAGEGVEP